MTYDVLNRLLHQIEMLRKLRSKRAHERRSLAAMRRCTREIEHLAAGDMAADYARDIGIALETLSKRGKAGIKFPRTIVPELIEHLVAYGLILSVASLSRISAV